MSWFVSSPGNGCCKWERMCQSLWKHQRLHCLHLHGRTEPSQVTPYTLYPNGKNHAKNIHLKALPGGVRIFQGSDIGRSNLMLGPPKDQLLLLSKFVGSLKNICRHMCFLFSSCDVFTDTCIDCSSGVLQCTVCHFQDTMPDGSCAACEWISFDVLSKYLETEPEKIFALMFSSVDCTNRFEDSCYLILNNTEQHDNAVNRWCIPQNHRIMSASISAFLQPLFVP